MAVRVLEDVFVTEGVPQETFIDPPNFNDIYVDIRHPTKPVVIEGPSGTGKTSCVKKKRFWSDSGERTIGCI